MASGATVIILPSQFPEAVRRDLIELLRTRTVNHKFHYDSIKQAQKWLALHEAYSPARQDAECRAIYDAGFTAAAARMGAGPVHLIGLGCGGGQKEVRLLQLLNQPTAETEYTPVDVSVALVLEAREAAIAAMPDMKCLPVVCDLATEEKLEETLAAQTSAGAARLVTFFGMIPNFEPRLILPRLAGLLRRDDLLLFSANLAPGPDYAAGTKRILPLYDNELTRDWLMTLLLDLGVEHADGVMRIGIEDGQEGLKRVVADFEFKRSRRIVAGGVAIDFQPGEIVRLFFSYRHTPQLVRTLLATNRIEVLEQWVTKSEEEGVFLCRKRK